MAANCFVKLDKTISEMFQSIFLVIAVVVAVAIDALLPFRTLTIDLLDLYAV